MFNVSKHAIGVLVNKRVRGKILAKRVSIRVEHVKHSLSRKEFLDRVKSNAAKKKEAKAAGKKADCKRHPKEPINAHTVSAVNNEPVFLAPIPYEFVA